MTTYTFQRMCTQMATAVGLLFLLLFAQYSHVGPFGSLGDKATDLCKNPKDQAATGSQRGTLKESIRNCALQCSLTGYMQTCVVSLGFTPSCAICYVDLVSCTKKRCLLPCLYPSARLCNQCSLQKCFPGLKRCTGLGDSELPAP